MLERIRALYRALVIEGADLREEVERLSAENAKLRAQLTDANSNRNREVQDLERMRKAAVEHAEKAESRAEQLTKDLCALHDRIKREQDFRNLPRQADRGVWHHVCPDFSGTQNFGGGNQWKGQGGELPKDAISYEREEKETVKPSRNPEVDAVARQGAKLDQLWKDGEPARQQQTIDGLKEDRRRLLAIVRDVANWSGHGNDGGGCVWDRWSHEVKDALGKLPASVEGEADPTRRRWNTTLPSEVESEP